MQGDSLLVLQCAGVNHIQRASAHSRDIKLTAGCIKFHVHGDVLFTVIGERNLLDNLVGLQVEDGHAAGARNEGPA